MQWEQDALDLISKAPALLRPMIRRKVEGRVSGRGGVVVTVADVNEARGALAPKSAQAAANGVSGIHSRNEISADEAGVAGVSAIHCRNETTTDEIGISADEIEKVIASTPQSAVVSESRYYEVKVCGGAFGCPRTLFDVRGLADKIIARIDASGAADAVAARVKGPVLRHHKFSVAISGCPNSCSQPQINDFGVQGRARVSVTTDPCIECMECVRVCNEGSVKVEDAAPQIDRSKCINCGDCAAVCPTGSLIADERGFTALIGGKLGRHPQLARELLEFTDEAGLLAALDVALAVFKSEMLPGERLADAVTRIGVDDLQKRVPS